MQCANGRYFYVSRFFVILSVIWKRFLSEFKIETLPNQKYYRITKRDAINSQFILVGSFLCFFWNAQIWWIFKTINFPFEIELPATIKQTICEFVVSKKKCHPILCDFPAKNCFSLRKTGTGTRTFRFDQEKLIRISMLENGVWSGSDVYER